MTVRLSVVMPAHNEGDYLRAAVESVIAGLSATVAFEVVIVENGSTDDTVAVAQSLGAEHQEVRTLRLDGADYGLALRAGVLEAHGEWVVIFDVDFVDLGFLDEARTMAERTGAAIVVGSKRSPGSDDRRGPGRRLVTAVFSLLLRYAFGLGVSDTHGLKLLHRPLVVGIVRASTFGEDIFDTEVILRAERAGLTVTEIPVRVADQRPPRTPILRRIPRSLIGLGRLRLALWTSPQRP